MLVRAKVSMVHGNVLREPGETFSWAGPGEPPGELCEKVGAKAAKSPENTREGEPYAASMRATRASATAK